MDVNDHMRARYLELVRAAVAASGLDSTAMALRTFGSCLVRGAVALKLSEEGWSEASIGRVMWRSPSTVHHMKVRMRDMLSLPGMYPEAAEIWKILEEIASTGR